MFTEYVLNSILETSRSYTHFLNWIDTKITIKTFSWEKILIGVVVKTWWLQCTFSNRKICIDRSSISLNRTAIKLIQTTKMNKIGLFMNKLQRIYFKLIWIKSKVLWTPQLLTIHKWKTYTLREVWIWLEGIVLELRNA